MPQQWTIKWNSENLDIKLNSFKFKRMLFFFFKELPSPVTQTIDMRHES